jgi:hypothetical protein
MAAPVQSLINFDQLLCIELFNIMLNYFLSIKGTIEHRFYPIEWPKTKIRGEIQ